MRKFGLGRIHKPDDRDHKYLLSAVTPEQRPKTKAWRLTDHLDQGDTPRCVGYSWKHFLLAQPTRQKQLTGEVIYRGAQECDNTPGSDYEGSTVRGGAIFLTDQAKLVHEYRWAFNLDDVLDAIGSKGPVVMGTNWTRGMFKPNAEHIVRATGPVEGGHAYVIRAYDERRELALIHNSWGKDWPGSFNGCAWLPYADLAQLLKADGEACMALER